MTSADKSGQKSMHACLEIGLSEMNLVSDCSSDACVACFCADPHSDFHYRKFGAYRIEFDLSPCQVEFPLTSRANYRHIWLEKVLYEPDLQRQALRKRLQVFRRRAEAFESWVYLHRRFHAGDCIKPMDIHCQTPGLSRRERVASRLPPKDG